MRYRYTCQFCGEVVYTTPYPEHVRIWGELADHEWIVEPQVEYMLVAWGAHLLTTHKDLEPIEITWRFSGEIVDTPTDAPGEEE